MIPLISFLHVKITSSFHGHVFFFASTNCSFFFFASIDIDKTTPELLQKPFIFFVSSGNFKVRHKLNKIESNDFAVSHLFLNYIPGSGGFSFAAAQKNKYQIRHLNKTCLTNNFQADQTNSSIYFMLDLKLLPRIFFVSKLISRNFDANKHAKCTFYIVYEMNNRRKHKSFTLSINKNAQKGVAVPLPTRRKCSTIFLK